MFQLDYQKLREIFDWPNIYLDSLSNERVQKHSKLIINLQEEKDESKQYEEAKT